MAGPRSSRKWNGGKRWEPIIYSCRSPSGIKNLFCANLRDRFIIRLSRSKFVPSWQRTGNQEDPRLLHESVCFYRQEVDETVLAVCLEFYKLACLHLCLCGLDMLREGYAQCCQETSKRHWLLPRSAANQIGITATFG